MERSILVQRKVRARSVVIGNTVAVLEALAAMVSPTSPAASKVSGLLRGLETYVVGQAALIIDYAAARYVAEPISTAPTEGAVQWMLHRRMGANQQALVAPRGEYDVKDSNRRGEPHLRAGLCFR